MLGLISIPTVHALTRETSTTLKFAEVEDITNANTHMSGVGTLEGSGTANVTLTYSTGEFKLLPGASEEESGTTERPANYAWIGLRIKLPKATTKYSINGGEEVETKVGYDEIDEYFGMDVATFTKASQAGEDIVFNYKVEWIDSEEKSLIQNIKVIVKPEGVTLYDQDGLTKKWTEEEYLKESGQVKLTVTGKYDSEQDGFSVGDTVYVKKGKISKETVDEVIDSLLGENKKHLTAGGYYSDYDLKNAFDFSKDVEDDTNIYVNLVVPTVEETKPDQEKSPATGDNILTVVAVAGMTLVAILGTMVALKKVNER